jgi:hypothetical protein
MADMLSWTRRIPVLLGASFALCACASTGGEENTSAEWPHLAFITPAGDPRRSPRSEAGNGQNEFVFSTVDDKDRGVLTIHLKVEARAGADFAQLTQLASGLQFDVDEIPGSSKDWDPNNVDGEPKVENGQLTATVSFTGLPSLNSSFGLKTVRLRYARRGKVLLEQPFEVFYTGTGKNHPNVVYCSRCISARHCRADRRAGLPSTEANWFYYYRQNAIEQTLACGFFKYGCDEASRRSFSVNGFGESWIRICDEAYNGNNQYRLTSKGPGPLRITGRSEDLRYYTSFVAVLIHERDHAKKNETACVNANFDIDFDGDGLTDEREIQVTRTDPERAYSADEPPAKDADCRPKPSATGEQALPAPGVLDSEAYAGGEVEECAALRADTPTDWSSPGRNDGAGFKLSVPGEQGSPNSCLR